MAICAATIALWLKHRMKHISSRGPYLSSRKVAGFASLLSPYKSCSSLHLWNDALIFILVFSLAWTNSFFLHCFFFLFLLFDEGNGGHFLALLSLSVLRHCLQFGLESIWPGKREEGRGAAQYRTGLPAAYAWEWLTLLRYSPWLWLVVLSQVDSCKSN